MPIKGSRALNAEHSWPTWGYGRPRSKGTLWEGTQQLSAPGWPVNIVSLSA